MARMAVDVGARVSQYEVTSAPVPGTVGRGRLRLVWVRPPEVLVEAGSGAEVSAGAGVEVEAAAELTVAAEVAGGSPRRTLAVLDAYRITRVPERILPAAS